MSKAQLPIFLEPLPVKRKSGSYKVIKDADLLVKITSIAAALGDTSRYTWLKLPFTEDFNRVANATTLPIVILGGGRHSNIKELLTNLGRAISAGHQVKGAMFGRNLLYPQSSDPLKLANAIGRLIHGKGIPEGLIMTSKSE
jgi:DhnA family fructose-bisphosphate aldolase class Ia